MLHQSQIYFWFYTKHEQALIEQVTVLRGCDDNLFKGCIAIQLLDHRRQLDRFRAGAQDCDDFEASNGSRCFSPPKVNHRFNAKPNPAEKKRVKPPEPVCEGKLRPKAAVSPRRPDT